MRQSEHTTNIFMHETAMHVDAPNQPEEVSAAHIGALTSCLTSVQEAIDAICSIDVKSLTSMPTVALARTSYAAVALVKLYSLASTADSKIGQVIDPASLRVEHHLDRVINHYKVAGEQIGGRTPAKFSTVLSLLRNWFVKRKDQNPALREAFGVPRQEEQVCLPAVMVMGQYSQKQAQTQTQTQKNTPLHLLSEVAMDPNRQYPRPETEAESWANYQSQSQPTESRPFYPMQQHPQYPDMSTYDTTGMLQPEPCFVPELGVQMGFYPENLFALGNMLDEGFFNLPFGYVGDGGGGGGGGGFYQ